MILLTPLRDRLLATAASRVDHGPWPILQPVGAPLLATSSRDDETIRRPASRLAAGLAAFTPRDRLRSASRLDGRDR